MRDDVTSRSPQQSTGSFDASYYSSSREEESDKRMLYRVGQAAMIVSGAALVALAARQRSSRKRASEWESPETLVPEVSKVPAPVEAAVTVNRPASELYAFWRRFENLPQFMRHLERVEDIGGNRSHWVGKSLLGFKVEWDAETIEEQEGRLLSWRSLPGSQVHNAGTITFTESANGRGTVVHVSMELRAAGGAIGQAVGKAFAPFTEQQVREDLRRFKHLMETGEIPTIDGQPAGSRHLINIRNPF